MPNKTAHNCSFGVEFIEILVGTVVEHSTTEKKSQRQFEIIADTYTLPYITTEAFITIKFHAIKVAIISLEKKSFDNCVKKCITQMRS